MEKTLEVHLQEQRKALLEMIAKDFENYSRIEILSNEHSYNDCAVIAKMYLKMANEVRRYK
jgi:hypothetical protein